MSNLIIPQGKIILGTERIRCPRCGRINSFEIHSDLPARDLRACGACGYAAVIDFTPILDKYGIPPGLSKPEKRQVSRHLKGNIAKLQ